MSHRYWAIFVLSLSLASVAEAHVSYSNRNLGTLGDSLKTISNQTVSSSYGWADATDDDFGDSHRGRFFKFHLDAPSAVRVTVQRNTLGTGPQGTFLPAFSLYRGLGQDAPEQQGRDASALSVASRPPGTEGSARALVDWSVGNDPTYVVPNEPSSGILYDARLAFFTLPGHAADGSSANYGPVPGIEGDGLADGFVTGVFELAAGDYTLWVGGANYDGQLSESAPFPTFGVTVSAGIVTNPTPTVLQSWGGLKARYR